MKAVYRVSEAASKETSPDDVNSIMVPIRLQAVLPEGQPGAEPGLISSWQLCLMNWATVLTDDLINGLHWATREKAIEGVRLSNIEPSSRQWSMMRCCC